MMVAREDGESGVLPRREESGEEVDDMEESLEENERGNPS